LPTKGVALQLIIMDILLIHPWPTVNRIDDVFGDRNLICSCRVLVVI
jgi:hypothetical protein